MVDRCTKALNLQNKGERVDMVSKSISWQHSFVL